MSTSKLNFELDKVKISSKALAISDSSAKAIAEKVFNDVLDGKISAVTAMEAFTLMSKAGAEFKDLTDETGNISLNSLICEEITLNAEDKKGYITPKGTKFSLAETGTKYDYSSCGDPLYDNLIAKKKVIDEEVKSRETFLKTIKDFMIVSIPDPETGELQENITITAPIKTSNSSYKVALLKG